jgi:hypothetical protein
MSLLGRDLQQPPDDHLKCLWEALSKMLQHSLEHVGKKHKQLSQQLQGGCKAKRAKAQLMYNSAGKSSQLLQPSVSLGMCPPQ